MFRRPPRLPLIAPSVLSADFARVGDECAAILGAGAPDPGAADLLHLDVMDGHFVPNLTMGPDMCSALRRRLPTAFLDTHLMVTDPAMFVEPFAKAGANHLTFHVEVMDADAARTLADRARALGLTAGIAINPPTPVERLLPLVPHFDLILVMSVNPGFSGQSFIAPTLEKTRAVKARLRTDQRLQMDGGISPANAAEVRAAGCDVIVGGNAIFGLPAAQRPAAIRAMRGRSTAGEPPSHILVLRDMLFMVIERPRDLTAVGERFRSKGRLLPEGVSYLDSWLTPDGTICYQLMEAACPDPLDRWIAAWADLVDFEVHPVERSGDYWRRVNTPG